MIYLVFDLLNLLTLRIEIFEMANWCFNCLKNARLRCFCCDLTDDSIGSAITCTFDWFFAI